MAEEITLAFIARQLERVLAEQRDMRAEQRFIREELRVLGTTLARLEDSIMMDLLERIRHLEADRPASQ
jgi:hypothetical protein